MLNKLLALLLSAGLLLSPLNAADSPSATSGELTANVAVTVGKQQGAWEKYECVTQKRKIIKDEPYYNSITEYVTKDQNKRYLPTAQGYDGLTPEGNINWLQPSKLEIWYSSTTGGSSRPASGYITYGNSAYSVTSCFLTFCQWQNSTVEWIYETSSRVWLEEETYDVAGDFVSDVTADKGSLPNNGRHTDGYWYVFKKLVED